MWGSSNAEAERLFRSQFEQIDGRLVFRRDRKGKPVIVRQEEVEEAVSLFLTRQKIVMRVGVAAMIAALVALVLIDDGKWIDRDGSTWILIAAWIVPFMFAWFWAWRSPTKRFNHRIPVGDERSRSELRAQMLREWSWWKIVWPFGLGLLFALPQIAAWPPTTIDDWIWFLMGAVLVALGSLQAFRKWRVK